MNNINGLSYDLTQGRVMVVGDIMLDSFIYGDVSRISPEAPVPVLKQSESRLMLGGAGNVLANLTALGAQALLVSVIGQDEAGNDVSRMVQALGVETDGLIRDEARPTIQKTRYIANGQQMMRLDQEDVTPVNDEVGRALLKQAEQGIKSCDIMVLSDYGKGVLGNGFITALIKLAKKHKVAVIVDPKGNDFTRYQGADFITPNRAELSTATGGMTVTTDQEVEQAAKYLVKNCKIENVVATRSEDGMSFIPRTGKPVHLKTTAQEVYDVSGAGDTVVAVLAAALAAGSQPVEAMHLANVAGGLVVAKVGTATISAKELAEELTHGKRGTSATLTMIAPVMKNWEAAKAQVETWQAQGKKVGFTNGCFDIVHYGHVNYLAQARGRCDCLILALNHDQSVRLLKGPTRPVNDQMARATVMAALSSVDMVVFFGAEKEGDDNTPCEIVGYLQPDILMKGGDYTVDQLPEGQVVLSYGGTVDIMPLYDGYSTTNIIQKSKA